MSKPECMVAGLGVWWKEVARLPELKAGFVGIPENAHQLLEAEKFLRQNGCNTVIGPMEGNTWRTHRSVVESDGSPPFLLEPVTPPKTAQIFESQDYQVLSRYSSSIIDLKNSLIDSTKLEARLKRNGVAIRKINLHYFENELIKIHLLSLECFSKNFLYTPIGQKEFLDMYQRVSPLLDSDSAFLAEANGEPVGFVFGYPDDNRYVVKSLAVRQERRFAGLGTLLVQNMHNAAESKGFTSAIHALQHESNTSNKISSRFDARVFRRYALFSKSL